MASKRSVLPHDHLEVVTSWGEATRSTAYVWRPSTLDQLADLFRMAQASGRRVCFKGSGCSYGDAFQNSEEIVVTTERLNRILHWNPEFGIIDVEPGVTLGQLWRHTIEDGWWPSVVSGTMMTSVGGCAAMNIHGKNAWKVGTFGEQILEFDLMTADGSMRTVTPQSDPDLFHGAISGFGMLGCMTRIRLRMKRVYSGKLRVTARAANTIEEQFSAFEEMADKSDYMVGWADGFAGREKNLLRGELHFANYLEAGEDPAPARSLAIREQELHELLFGFMPATVFKYFLRPFVNNLGMRAINSAKMLAQRRPGADKPYLQSHAQFAFLLDFIPGWKEAYRPGGLIQFQSFLGKESAADVFRAQLRACHRAGLPPYLCVTKKHRPDPFLISHGIDGYSLALDFPVTKRNRAALWTLAQRLGEMAVEANGKLYFAKDSTMPEGFHRRYLDPKKLQTFEALCRKHDPQGLISSNLYRRVFGDDRRVGEQTGANTPATIHSVSA